MRLLNLRRRRRIGHLVALGSGALLPLAFAPWDLWQLTLVLPALYALTLIGAAPVTGFFRGWLFGLGLFGTGASWVYVSIHVYGYTAAPLAALLTFAFCAGLALFYAFPAWLFCRFISGTPEGNTLGFAALWVLGEWLRSWLFTGFPWLYLGQAHTDTWLGAGFAPVFGVFGLSLFCAITAVGFSALFFRGHLRAALLCLLVGSTAFVAGQNLSWQSWNKAVDERLSVALIQPDIPQEQKWLPEQYWPTLEKLTELSDSMWDDNDLVIWPEAAIPTMYDKAGHFLDPMTDIATQHDAGLITGVLRQHNGRYYNAVIGLGGASGEYHKQHLVPFGEYVPFESVLRDLIRFFNLPTSTISPGTSPQPLLQFNERRIATSICYEIAYPEHVRKSAGRADVLLTVSNDGWFGRSIGPDQHLQIARLRAMENAKPVIRATGRGHTALIDYRGRVTHQAPFFKPAAIEGTVRPRIGETPFGRWGSEPVLAYCVLMILLSLLMRWLHRRNIAADRERVEADEPA